MKSFTLFILISLHYFSANCQSDNITKKNQTKNYTLQKQADNSDFNYFKINNIDSIYFNTSGDINKLNEIFEPITGKYKYYKFIATYKGESYTNKTSEFHDVLIVKTDNNNKIIDAFHFTLEWKEPPLQSDLYKSKTINKFLTNKMEINDFNFFNNINLENNYNELKEKGIIILK
jgi:hypothetical protein